jgi:probable dihydroxyacetone kinase regulator
MADSLITKKAIADSLKELTKEKSFDKISVKDISEKCGINRQTFYYHFVDKYALLEWIYQTELLEKILADVTLDNWREKFTLTLKTMKEEKRFYINTINHTEDYIQRFMIDQAGNLFIRAIDELDERSKVREEQRKFFSRFFAYGVCGIVIEWVSGGMLQEPEVIIDNLWELLTYCERAAYAKVTEEGFIDER